METIGRAFTVNPLYDFLVSRVLGWRMLRVAIFATVLPMLADPDHSATKKGPSSPSRP